MKHGIPHSRNTVFFSLILFLSVREPSQANILDEHAIAFVLRNGKENENKNLTSTIAKCANIECALTASNLNEREIERMKSREKKVRSHTRSGI